MKKLIIGILIGLVIGVIIGYFSYGLINKPNNFSNNRFSGGNNFQIDENTKQEIISFFDSTEDINEINSYCEENRMNCVYYCGNVNSEHEICSSLERIIGNRSRSP